MLIIAIVVLLLAVTSSINLNYNYLADYVKFNRIVFIIFILSGYLAYNILDVDALNNGIGIYGGVFKITILSQVFDIILFITGAIITILTCFVPYNFKNYDDSKSVNYNLDNNNENIIKENIHYTFFKSNLKDYYNKVILNYYTNINKSNKSSIYIFFVNKIDKLFKFLPNIKLNTPYLIVNNNNYSRLEVKEYSFLLLYTVLGGSLLISSQNLISLYLSLELQSFTLYILSTSQIRSFKGTSGGLKYFLLGGLSSGFILLGCSLLYAYTGTLNLEYIFMIYSDNFSNYFIDPCLLILFAGLLFKVSAAPFHNWAPDVYNDVPTYSTAWLIVIAKLSILILMLILIHNIHSGLNLNDLNSLEQYYSYYNNIESNSLHNNDFKSLNNISSLFVSNDVSFSLWNPSYSSLGLWTNVLTLSALFSLIIGTVLGISQSKIKRLFAYSTITHVGFLLLALSLNSITSLDAFIFYLIQYTITNINLFFILIAWGYLYCRYYLEKDFIPIRILKVNPYSFKDIYIEPTLYDFFDYAKDNKIIGEKYNNLFHPYKNIKINTISKNLLLDQNFQYNDFNIEDNEWLYTPVPFLTNFKGMNSRDPFLAFCLSATIFSLAGVPPLIGFFAKQQILLASIQLDYYLISIVAIFTSVVGAAYYLRIVKFIYFYDDVFVPYYLNNDKSIGNNNDNFNNKSIFTLGSLNYDNILPMLPSNNLSLVIAILTNISLFYILKPYVLVNIIYTVTIPLFQI